jgi:methanogenic corrinoid protein MtbC1
VCFLGANVPRSDLKLSLEDFAPHVLALSVTLGLHLRGAAAIVESAHALTPPVPVLVGGPAFASDPDLWRTIGADAVSDDAVAAERRARELV